MCCLVLSCLVLSCLVSVSMWCCVLCCMVCLCGRGVVDCGVCLVCLRVSRHAEKAWKTRVWIPCVHSKRLRVCRHHAQMLKRHVRVVPVTHGTCWICTHGGQGGREGNHRQVSVYQDWSTWSYHLLERLSKVTTKKQVSRTICALVSLEASTWVSPDFALLTDTQPHKNTQHHRHTTPQTHNNTHTQQQQHTQHTDSHTTHHTHSHTHVHMHKHIDTYTYTTPDNTHKKNGRHTTQHTTQHSAAQYSTAQHRTHHTGAREEKKGRSPEGHCGGNQPSDGSIRLSPPNPSIKNDLRDLPKWFRVFATFLINIFYIEKCCLHVIMNRKPQHWNWHCVGANRPQHMHMHSHMVCVFEIWTHTKNSNRWKI